MPLPSFLVMMGDDIGWADFGYNGGIALAPRIKEWTGAPGTITMQDFPSGGTTCAPTRASVLTGRNHFRECVDDVFMCSDMTECVPDFEFAPQRSFTIADAVRAANRKHGYNYTSYVSRQPRSPPAGTRHCAASLLSARAARRLRLYQQPLRLRLGGEGLHARLEAGARRAGLAQRSALAWPPRLKLG